ncbi:uncharacterized protein BDZ99DRAFT_465006, partial [Mytilinidion resinicola]
MSAGIGKGAQQSIAERLDDAPPTLPPFMRLPLEMRRKIYQYLLKAVLYIVLSPMRTQLGWEIHGKSRFCKYRYERGRLRSPLFPAILGVNHQIHIEATDVLYGENFFMLHYDAGVRNGQPLRAKLPNYFDKIKNVWVSTEDMSDLVADDFPQSLQTMRLFSSMNVTHKRHVCHGFQLVAALRRAGLQMIEFDEQYKSLGEFKPLLVCLMNKGEKEVYRRLKQSGVEKPGTLTREMANLHLG